MADDSAPAFDRQFVASISGSSTALGQCLRSTLVELTDPKTKEAQKTVVGEEEEQPTPKRIKIDSEAVDSILKSFGGAMADTQIQANELASSSSAAEFAPPRALLHARLDHYNRVGQNWRMVIDKIKIQKRPPLLDERPRRRKKVSFFRDDVKYASSIPGEVQILAYNDI